MLSKIYSAIPIGYSGQLIEVEGDLSQGLPTFNVVGLANKTITEARDRVRSAIKSSGFSFPTQKITVNLAPAELAKDGPYLDVPLALSVLILSEQLLNRDVAHKLFVGELSLDGQIRPVRGIINIVEIAKTDPKITQIFLPYKNLPQASLIHDIDIIGAHTLAELFQILKHQTAAPSLINTKKSLSRNSSGAPAKQSASLHSPRSPTPTIPPNQNAITFDDIKEQPLVKRALAIAVAGRHNILLSGPPGTGKTALGRAALNLLPNPSPTEQVSITKLHSLAGLASDEIIATRPFRSPHHSSSLVSLIGGGSNALPGEISLSHLGVLFLDELPEYSRSALESLRQPLEDRQISISRANRKTTYPADFMLIATMNPCPCGYAGDPNHTCTCTAGQIARYQKKLSGPLLDRIDLFIRVNRVKNQALLQKSPDTSEHSRYQKLIRTALNRQRARYHTQTVYNSSLTSKQINSLLNIAPDAKQLLSVASDKLALSARAYFKILRVAQTIADLEDADTISSSHISEALSFREPLSALPP